jgi:hypothetical protein
VRLSKAREVHRDVPLAVEIGAQFDAETGEMDRLTDWPGAEILLEPNFLQAARR